VRRLLTTVVTIALIAVGGYWAINTFFPPNPEAVLMVETTNGIDRLVTEQRWQEALDLVKSARAQLPMQPELMIWESVLNERLGNSEAAAAALTEAQKALVDQPVQVYIYLGNDRLRVGDVEGAQAAGEQALAMNPNEPQAYFLLGGIAETQGNVSTAIDYFEKTYELAEGENPQLAVIARVRMGQLMQNPGSIASPGDSPGATPTAAP
jgi:tetratricopeptide (TPR) repeat protein